MHEKDAEPQKTVLWDMDGTVVDTERLKARAHARTIESLGGRILPEDYALFMGKSREIVAAGFMERAEVQASFEEYSKTYERHYKVFLGADLHLVPGVFEVLDLLDAAGVHQSIVTSSSAEFMYYVLNSLGLQQFFPTGIAAGDVKRHKPCPDPYLKAMLETGAMSPWTVAVEDTESGVKSAFNAGIPVVAIRTAFNGGHSFYHAKAVLQSGFMHPETVVEVIMSSFRGELE